MAEKFLVIVLPGIGGSVLARPDNLDDVVWDMGLGDITDLVRRPGRLDASSVPELTPIGLCRTSRLMGFTVVPGYERLLTELATLGAVDPGDPRQPVLDADVVAVPYDFRLGVLPAAERLDRVVTARLGDLSAGERRGRVIVIAHSLGGLVARAWMVLTDAPRGEERWRWCRALVTVGTPHRGAPKALDQLVNGVRLLGRRLDRPTALLRQWPSVLELLPRYPAIRDTRVSTGGPGHALYPHDLPLEWLAPQAKRAYDLHLAIEAGWDDVPQKGPETVACIGWSHPTPDAAYWDGSQLVVTKETPDWLGLDGRDHDFGDGTVPAVSGLPTQFDNHVSSPIRLKDRHVPMAASSVLVELVKRYLSIGPPRMVHGDEEVTRPPAIGLDVDELQATDQPIRVGAVFREMPVDPSDLRVTARLEPVVGDGAAPDLVGSQSVPREPVSDRMRWDAGTGAFTAELPPGPPGLWRIRVIARDIPQVGDLEVEDRVAVLEGG